MAMMKRCNYCDANQASPTANPAPQTVNAKSANGIPANSQPSSGGFVSKPHVQTPISTSGSANSTAPAPPRYSNAAPSAFRRYRPAHIVLFGAALAFVFLIVSEEVKLQSDVTFVGQPPSSETVEIPLQRDFGVMLLNAQINSAVGVEFMLDSGAADVSLPSDVIQDLRNKGAITDSDSRGIGEYILANGQIERSQRYNLRSIQVGDIVVSNVLAGASPEGSPALLGQSFLSKFDSWHVDNSRNKLVLKLAD